MTERMRFADFHMDRANPWLEEILNNPEFRYAASRKKQLPREGLEKLDLHFATIYRRASDEIKSAARTGNEQVLATVRTELEKLIDYYRTTDHFHVIESYSDLKLQDRYDANNIVLHLEGADIITNPDVVDGLYERGVRSVGLVYNHDNKLGGGARGKKDRGLTALGKRVVDRMIQKGIIIDTSHANHKTSRDILQRVGDYTKTVTTHTTGFYGMTQRDITADILEDIARKGGVVGFFPVKPMFPSFEKYIENFRKASDVAGSVNHLAFASDFGGLDAEHLFEEFDEIGKLSLVAEQLSELGRFTDDDVAKIMYGNVERIVKQL